MKRKLIITMTIAMLIMSLTGCQAATKSFGGDMTLKLEPNQKLEAITWKENSLWYLTRPMRDDEVAEVHTFQQSSEWGVFEGTVTVIEYKKDYDAKTECIVAINNFLEEDFLNAINKKKNSESNVKEIFNGETISVYSFNCVGDPLNVKEKVDCMIVEVNYGNGNIHTEHFNDQTDKTAMDILKASLSKEELNNFSIQYSF